MERCPRDPLHGFRDGGIDKKEISPFTSEMNIDSVYHDRNVRFRLTLLLTMNRRLFMRCCDGFFKSVFDRTEKRAGPDICFTRIFFCVIFRPC